MSSFLQTKLLVGMQLAVVEKNFHPIRFLAPTGKDYEREIKQLRKQAAVTYLQNISMGRLETSILKCKLTSSIDILDVASLYATNCQRFSIIILS